MKLISRDRNGNLKTAGVKSGSFVKIFQGSRTINGSIGEVDYSGCGYECFRIYDKKPELTNGSGIYLVKEDFYLVHIESDYDTSD